MCWSDRPAEVPALDAPQARFPGALCARRRAFNAGAMRVPPRTNVAPRGSSVVLAAELRCRRRLCPPRTCERDRKHGGIGQHQSAAAEQPCRSPLQHTEVAGIAHAAKRPPSTRMLGRRDRCRRAAPSTTNRRQKSNEERAAGEPECEAQPAEHRSPSSAVAPPPAQQIRTSTRPTRHDADEHQRADQRSHAAVRALRAHAPPPGYVTRYNRYSTPGPG